MQICVSEEDAGHRPRVTLKDAYTSAWSAKTLGELVIFITLAAFAGGKKLTLAKGLKNEESGSMSFGFAITFAALLRFGPEAAVLVSTACAVSCGFFPKRQPAVQIAFNTALGVIEAFVGGLIFVIANGGSVQHALRRAAAAARREYVRAGLSMPVWRSGRLAWIHPTELQRYDTEGHGAAHVSLAATRAPQNDTT